MPFLYSPGHPLSIAELSAARIDGDLHSIAHAFMPSDIPESAPLRAAVLRALVPPRLALCRSSAAWVHGAGSEPPDLHHLQRAVPERVRVQTPIGVVFHDVATGAADITSIAGVAVTTVTCTIADMARTDTDDPRLVDLVTLHPEELPAAVAHLERAGRLPRKRPGLRRLREFYDDVTR